MEPARTFCYRWIIWIGSAISDVSYRVMVSETTQTTGSVIPAKKYSSPGVLSSFHHLVDEALR